MLGDLTCYIKLNLQRNFAGNTGVTQQLVGLFQRAVLCRDPIDGQESVTNLQDSTPAYSPTQRNQLINLRYWTEMKQ